MTPEPEIVRVDPGDLDALIARARAEAWPDLFLAGPALHPSYIRRRYTDGQFVHPLFELQADVEGLGNKCRGLSHLTSLYLDGNDIGDEGARAIAVLANLTWLDLGRNSIGDDGACAIAVLANLTSLDLSNNSIGDDGARAIADLANLTSLHLSNNSIGDDGARAIAALANLTSLNLSGNSIGVDGAHAFAALANLTSLDLSFNSIGDDGARAIAALANLTSLDLSDNSIGVDGARAIAKLADLTSLDLWGNGIGDDGARAIAALANLTSLDLSRNGIGGDGARAIAALANLTWLNLTNNSIGDDGAHAIADLANLTWLSLMNGSVGEDGARGLAALGNLTELNIGGNSIGDDGARAIADLANLTSLNLSSNDIGEVGVRTLLDAPLAATGRLQQLNLRDNAGLESVLPPEVIESIDAQAILAAYRRYRQAAADETLRPLNEAKLLVLGNEAVGKTSLIRYLVLDQPRDPDEQKTAGAAIHDKIDVQSWSAAASGIGLNVWDFGGQEVMHGTHRYFLTERSLYLLVLEDRREDNPPIHEWLKIIRNRGGDSPVVVVINKSDDGKEALQLDEAGLQAEYPSILGFLRTSCDPGEWAADSITRLRQAIATAIADDPRLTHVRDPIPASWLGVKDAIAEMAGRERMLRYSDFERLCSEPVAADGTAVDAITDADERRALLRLLHDLGIVVAHGLVRDAPATMREITLLDPNWLTAAIYKLLNEPAILRDQAGEFDHAQLKDWLDSAEYPEESHEFILAMMQDEDIGLCFELPDVKRRYLIPEALSPNMPHYENWPDDSLRFRYAYDLLPRRLIPSFIVQAHRNLADPPTRWRTGAVLEAAQCTILLRGDRERRTIDIQVAGPVGLRRSALNVVLNDLEDVHARNPEIGAEARVPLPDQPQLDVSYDHLLSLEARYDSEHEFDPEGADRAYTVKELLDGVRRERRAHEDERDERSDFHFVGRVQTYKPLVIVDARTDAAEVSSETDTDVNQAVPPPTGTRRYVVSSWPFISIACGVAAIVLSGLLMLVPAGGPRLTIGILLAIGLSVTVFVLLLNPKFFYRRLLGVFVLFGPLLAIADGSFELFADSGPVSGVLRKFGEVSPLFFLAWALVVGFLVWADVKQSTKSE